jgi:hypothetical protein
MTMPEIGFLCRCKISSTIETANSAPGFDPILESVEIKVRLWPPRSPNLNAHLERWNRSVKEIIQQKNERTLPAKVAWFS